MRRVVAAAAVVLACAGCGSSSLPLASSRAGASPMGSAGPASGEHLLLSDGRLYSEALDDGACFWFTSATGQTVSVVWPKGFTAKDGPLRVVDASGREVARTFQEGLGFTGHFEAGRTGCAPGGLSRSFVASKVSQAGVGSADEAR